MKKFISVIAAVLMLLSFSSCGGAKPSGKYFFRIGENELGSLDFSKDEVAIELNVPAPDGNLTVSTSGTYTVNENEIVVKCEDGKVRKFIYDSKEKTVKYSGFEFRKK